MATTRTISTLAGLAATTVLLVAWPAPREALRAAQQSLGHDGYAAAAERRQEPDAIEAAFPLESYRPGSVANLRLWTRVPGTTISIHRVGPDRPRTVGDKTMEGALVTPAQPVSGSSARVRIGRDWPSGLYFARLRAPGKLGFAPFIVRPRRLGEHPIAIVLPTRTWQAYNFRDDDRDGDGDTWYATRGSAARLGRPYLNRGVPPHFRKYDLYFLQWLERTGRAVDVLSQAELDATTGRRLAAAYELLVFPGHHEYVTTREYDAVEGFRNRGGNLIFLSANNFFWKIELRGRTMTRVAKWRELGRPEAALLGVQYVANDMGESRGPWLVQNAPATSWIFRGIRLRNGREFSNAGIEIDMVAPSSPPGTQILATIPNLLGPGLTAHMTYYETRRGAKVFSAGAFTLAGSIRQPTVKTLLENLWRRLATERRVVRRPAAARAGGWSYRWPLQPFDEQHPVRGFFGDPRVAENAHGRATSKTFHFGIDISAPDGTPVYAVSSGRIVWEPERPETVAVRGSDGRVFAYWHLVPSVRNGEHAIAHRTVLGRIAAGWGHVHLAELVGGRYVNPLRPSGLGPYQDTTRPRVRAFGFERAGVPVGAARVSGLVDLVAETLDETPLAVPGRWRDRPVMPALVRWRIVSPGGRAASWRTAVDFRESIPSAAAYDSHYARWTRQNHPWRDGRYRVLLASRWNSRTVANGTHVLEVEVSDTYGNRSRRSVRFAVRNG